MIVHLQEGYVLTQAVVRSPLGGDYLSMQCRQHLESHGIDLTPAYMVSTKESVREREPPRFTVKKMPDQLTKSWQQYMLKQLMQDYQLSTVQVLEVPYDDRAAAQIPSVHYEFPSGYHQDFGCERFKLAESLFDHSMLGAGQLASTSVGMCDTDVRMSLYGSVVITGGNSLLQVGILSIQFACDERRSVAWFLPLADKILVLISVFVAGLPRTLIT